MLRAGMIRKLASGLYTWLPMGVRVLNKVEAIVREEMNRAGALETFMPVTQPASLWEESGRYVQYGPELLRFKDRHDNPFVLGPTHEEVITDLARNELKSYKQLPINFYQIQTKFRDEIRPRFGVMRSREFIMKDAYSFHTDKASLQETYRCNVRHLLPYFLALRFTTSAQYKQIQVLLVVLVHMNSTFWLQAVKMISPSLPNLIMQPILKWLKLFWWVNVLLQRKNSTL